MDFDSHDVRLELFTHFDGLKHLEYPGDVLEWEVDAAPRIALPPVGDPPPIGPHLLRVSEKPRAVEWEIELVVEGRDGGPTATVVLAFDPGVNSVVALALLALQAERRVGEWIAAAQVAEIARRLGVTLGETHSN